MVGKVGTTKRDSGSNPGVSFGGSSDVMYQDPLMKQPAPAWMVTAVEELIFKVRKKNIWEIVDFCLSIWAAKHPKEHKLFLKDMETYRKTRKNKTASTTDKSMRSLVELPREVNYLLNKIAPHKIQEYGEKKFWREFARRYPAFRGGEKL